MECIGQRIKRLRLAKMMTQEVLADKTGATHEEVMEWEKEGAGPPPSDRHHLLSKALGVTVPELLTGSQNPAIDHADLGPKESIVLHLFGELFSHQQRELIEELRALVDANRYTGKFLEGKTLQGVSNEAVRAAFGDVPTPPKMKTRRKRRPPPNLKGDNGDHLGDRDVE